MHLRPGQTKPVPAATASASAASAVRAGVASEVLPLPSVGDYLAKL